AAGHPAGGAYRGGRGGCRRVTPVASTAARALQSGRTAGEGAPRMARSSADRVAGVAGLDPAALVEGALARIRQHYLFPDRLERIEAELRRLAEEARQALTDMRA